MRNSTLALSSRVVPAALFATAKLFPNISKTRMALFGALGVGGHTGYANAKPVMLNVAFR